MALIMKGLLMRYSSINRQSGITLIELLVVMSVMGIIIILVLDTLGDFYQSNINAVSRTTQTADTRSVLKSIQLDLSTSTGFLPESSATLATPLGSDNASSPWNYKGNDPEKPANRVLISKSYATDKAASDATRNLVYTGSCNPASATPLANTFVYFAQKDPETGKYNLYRRTIHGEGTPCVPPFQKQTCTASKLNTYSSICQGVDALLLYDIDEFKIDYFSSPSDTTPLSNQYPASGNADLSNVKTVQLSVTTKRKIGGVESPYTATMRVSRIN